MIIYICFKRRFKKKVFKNNKVYVQKEDLTLLLESGKVPASVFDVVYRNGFFIAGEDDRENYIEFNKSEQVEFFESQDWIVDYDEVKDLSLEELDLAFKNIQRELELILKGNKGQESVEKTHIRYELLNNRLYTLAKVYYHKSNKISLSLPNESRVTKLVRKFKTRINK